jgi:hypothetical protein
MCDFKDRLPEGGVERIQKSLLAFKYWIDEPGKDSMCYWSENHQILFAACEYLAGQLYQDKVFLNSGLTGREHIAKARKRILSWLGFRWDYGFSEWFSNMYYIENFAALANLVDFCIDEEITLKCKIVLDLLLYDIASQSFKGIFITTSGECTKQVKRAAKMYPSEILSSIYGDWRQTTNRRMILRKTQ